MPPRALGYVFLACGAAIFLDCGWYRFQAIYGQVVRRDIFHAAGEGSSPQHLEPVAQAHQFAFDQKLKFEIKKRMNLNTNAGELLDFIRSRFEFGEGDFLDFMRLAPKPPIDAWRSIEAASAVAASNGAEQVALAFNLEDFHMYEPLLNGVGLTACVVAASPRSAERRCASNVTKDTVDIFCERFQNGNSDDQTLRTLHNEVLKALESKEPPSPRDDAKDEQGWVRLETESTDDQACPSEKDGGSEYCPFCEMWLNGPTQMEDHKNGKKHKKNVRKPKNGQGAKQVANKMKDKEPPVHERENRSEKAPPSHTGDQESQWPSKKQQHMVSSWPQIHPEQQRMQQQWCPSATHWWADSGQQISMFPSNQRWAAAWDQQPQTTWDVNTEMQQMTEPWAGCNPSNFTMSVHNMQ